MRLLPTLAVTAVLAVPGTAGAVMMLSANSMAAPTPAAVTGQPEPGDDNGGDRDRDQRTEPGDDRDSDAPEPGDDDGGDRDRDQRTEPGDDRDSDAPEPGDDNGGDRDRDQRTEPGDDHGHGGDDDD